MSTVDVEVYLIVGAKVRENGSAIGTPAARITKHKPALDTNEVAIKLCVSVPSALFMKPQLSASIIVPEESIPYEITPVVQDNIAEAIRNVTGLSVAISVDGGPVHE